VYFALPEDQNGFAATGEVKNHYYLNYGNNGKTSSVTGMGVRFTAFDNNGHHALERSLRQQLH